VKNVVKKDVKCVVKKYVKYIVKNDSGGTRHSPNGTLGRSNGRPGLSAQLIMIV
jgi:hypothetical protein